MKHTKFSDEWGEIVEYVRFRGKRGQYISDKWGRTLERRDSPYVKRETRQWLIDDRGRKLEEILVESPDRVMKTTSPFAVADAEGDIYEALRSTNIMRQISQATTALINIRGINRRGERVRLQGEITVGDKNADQQLAMAVNAILQDNGYGEENYYDLMRLRRAGRRTRTQNIKLSETQITVTLLRG
jgi:hypothetical protein